MLNFNLNNKRCFLFYKLIKKQTEIGSYTNTEHFIKWIDKYKKYKIDTKFNNNLTESVIHSIEFEFCTSFFNFYSNADIKGSGIYHLSKIRKTKNFFIPAVVGTLSKSYEMFKANNIQFEWLWKINYISIIKNIFLKPKKITNNYFFRDNEFQVSNIIDDNIVNKISTLTGLDYTFIKWRLESRENKRVFIGTTTRDNSFIIGVIGKRKNVKVLRIICCYGNENNIIQIIKLINNVSEVFGVILILATLNKYLASKIIKELGFKQNKKKIKTYLKNELPIKNEFYMLIGDLGFEEQWSL